MKTTHYKYSNEDYAEFFYNLEIRMAAKRKSNLSDLDDMIYSNDDIQDEFDNKQDEQIKTEEVEDSYEVEDTYEDIKDTYEVEDTYEESNFTNSESVIEPYELYVNESEEIIFEDKDQLQTNDNYSINSSETNENDDNIKIQYNTDAFKILERMIALHNSNSEISE